MLIDVFEFLDFSEIGNFIVDGFSHAPVFAIAFISSFGGTHGATAVDFVFGVLMEVVVEANIIGLFRTSVIKRITYCMIDSSFF